MSENVGGLENPPVPTIENKLVKFFTQVYPEFTPIALKSEQTIINMFHKIACLYPKYRELAKDSPDTQCELYYSFFMLIGHYLVINGFAQELGLNKSTGLISSSSIDGVSVSFQTAPYKDNYQYFFNQTPYGQEYLAYLSTQSGLRYINNAYDRF